MQKEQICTKECLLGNQEILKYFVDSYYSEPEMPIYEIRIEKWRNHQLVEWEATGPLTENLNKAVVFMEKLKRNYITPMCLLEVTDDCFYDMML